MLRGLVLALLFAAVGANAQLTRPVASQPLMNYGGAVLPQNYMQPVAGQLNAPVLTPQQAMNLIPIDQLQTALNQRVAALGAVQQPYVQTTQPIGFGLGAQPIQQPIGVGLTQQPIGFGTQQPIGFGLGGVQQLQQPYGLGVGVTQPVGFGLGQQQQIPLGMGVGGFGQPVQQPILGVQQPLGFGGVQAQQPIWAQQPMQQQQPVFLQQAGGPGMMGPMGPM